MGGVQTHDSPLFKNTKSLILSSVEVAWRNSSSFKESTAPDASWLPVYQLVQGMRHNGEKKGGQNKREP